MKKVMKACVITILSLLFAINSLVLGGCSELTGPRDEEANILISLSLSAESEQPGDKIFVISSVRNVGNISVLRPVDCTGGGAFLELLDPEGQIVCPVIYGDLLPLCPSHEEEFNSGVLETSLEFAGMLWEGEEGYPAPSGVYTVRASFLYRVPGKRQVIKHEQTSFLWDAD
jgi:hypothetical protein